MQYSPQTITTIFRQWANGNLDNLGADAQVSAGLKNCVVRASGGVRAQSLVERTTSDDVVQALASISRRFSVALIARYLLGWELERLARAAESQDVTASSSLLLLAEDAFVRALLNNEES